MVFAPGGVYGGFLFLCGVASRCEHRVPGVAGRLGLGTAGVAWRRRVVSGAAVFVRAVCVAAFRGGVRAGCFRLRLAGVGAVWFGWHAGVRGLRFAGAGFRGQGGVAGRFFISCGSRGAVRLGAGGLMGCLCFFRRRVLPASGFTLT